MTTAVEELKRRFTDELAAIRSLHDYAGDDWWQLSAAEAEVFGLELDDMPALVSAWAMYEAVADIAYPEFPGAALCQRLRAELPFIQPRVSDLRAWEKFAALLGIRGAKAYAWFFKYDFGQENTWIISRPDDDLPMPRAAVAPRTVLDGDIPF
jgi:hypothetical protein